MGQSVRGAFPWGTEHDISGSGASDLDEDDQVADDLVDHVEACLAQVLRSPWWDFLGCRALEPDAAEVALVMLTGEVPDRGLPREWDALTAVVRAMVLRRVGEAP